MTFYHKTNFETKKKLDFQLISWEEVVPELSVFSLNFRLAWLSCALFL
jgi:hypothetical protein